MSNAEDVALLEAVANWTFSGLTLYYRDTPLVPRQLAQYRVGGYLRNNFFVDVAPFSEGVVGNTRYLIASSKAAALHAVASNPDLKRWQLHVLNANSCFKMLDICGDERATQVLLLHVPRRWATSLPGAQFSLEEQIIATARQRFAEKVGRPPSPELQEPNWRKRVELAIGLDDQDRPTEVARPADVGAALSLYLAIEKLVGDATGLNQYLADSEALATSVRVLLEQEWARKKPTARSWMHLHITPPFPSAWPPSGDGDLVFYAWATGMTPESAAPVDAA